MKKLPESPSLARNRVYIWEIALLLEIESRVRSNQALVARCVALASRFGYPQFACALATVSPTQAAPCHLPPTTLRGLSALRHPTLLAL